MQRLAIEVLFFFFFLWEEMLVYQYIAINLEKYIYESDETGEKLAFGD